MPVWEMPVGHAAMHALAAGENGVLTGLFAEDRNRLVSGAGWWIGRVSAIGMNCGCVAVVFAVSAAGKRDVRDVRMACGMRQGGGCPVWRNRM